MQPQTFVIPTNCCKVMTEQYLERMTGIQLWHYLIQIVGVIQLNNNTMIISRVARGSLPKWGRWSPVEAKLTPKSTAFLCVTVLHKHQTRRQNLFFFRLKIFCDVFFLPILVAYDKGKNLWGNLCIQIEYGVLVIKISNKSDIEIRSRNYLRYHNLHATNWNFKVPVSKIEVIWFLVVFYCNRGWKKCRTFIASTFGYE